MRVNKGYLSQVFENSTSFILMYVFKLEQFGRKNPISEIKREASILVLLCTVTETSSSWWIHFYKRSLEHCYLLFYCFTHCPNIAVVKSIQTHTVYFANRVKSLHKRIIILQNLNVFHMSLTKRTDR